MTIIEHAHIYRFHTSNFNFGEIFFQIFLSIQPLSLSWSEGDGGGFDGRDDMVKISILGRWPGGGGGGEPYGETNR